MDSRAIVSTASKKIVPIENENTAITTTQKIMQAIKTGSGIMLAQTPVVNALNQMSVVACRRNASSRVACYMIYRGDLNGGISSLWNFRAGIGGHLSKEIPRLIFKPAGLYLFKPWLCTKMSPAQSDLAFAGTLSLTEILINPADTWRVNMQAGDKLERSFRRLYAGSLGNGIRQFGTWWGFSYSDRKLNTGLQNYTSIDPHSSLGISVKAIPQSLFFTTLVYGIERVKNEIQYNRQNALNPTNRITSYRGAFHDVFHTQGWQGFFRGYPPKVLANAVLAAGATYLVEKGRQKK